MGIRMSLLIRRNAPTWPEELFHFPKKYLQVVMGFLTSLFIRRNTPTLPEELIFSEILPKLPTKSLIQVKSVSKKWRELIANDAALKKAHARHHRTTARNYHEISIVALKKNNDKANQKLVFFTGDDRRAREFETPRELKDVIFEGIVSCNGLVLVSKPLALWNPATGEFRALPEPLEDEIPDKNSPILGLGFDEESGDHKVVRVTRDLSNPDVQSLNLQVLSKRAGSWRKLRPFPGFTLCKTILGGGRVSSDGALYFICKQSSHFKIAVMSFTFRNEEVQKLTDGPEYRSLPDGRFRIYNLRLMKWKEDSLAFISQDPASEKPQVCDFWVMSKNDSDGFCWSKLFVLDCFGDIRGVWSDRIVIARKGMTELALWDPQTDCKKHNCLFLVELNDKPLVCYFSAAIDYIDYVPTLLSVY